MDVLANLIDLLRIRGYLYGRLELSAPFAYQFTGAPGICVMVMSGTALLEVHGQKRVHLGSGDLALVLEPSQYILRSDLKTPLTHIRTVTTPEEFHSKNYLSAGGGGVVASLVAGGFTMSPGSEWLTKHLPRVMHLSSTDHQSSPWYASMLPILGLMGEELGQNRPGASAIVDRLAEVFFVQAVRSQVYASVRGEPNWLRALADPQIGESLRLMHSEPGRKWTVTQLAGCVGMSRSAFATRFRKLVGTTPLCHLTEWRVVNAARRLREDPSLQVSGVALAMGYESDAAFGKVFRRIIGTPPGKYRYQEVRR